MRLVIAGYLLQPILLNSMSTQLFPKLAGLTWDIKAVPTWSTVKQISRRRARTALMNDPYPQWTFELTFEFLRDSPVQRPGGGSNPNNYTELEHLVGFFNQMGGDFDSFLLDPGWLTERPSDSQVAGAPLGVGDGTTTVFYTQRDAGGFIDEVQAPCAPIFVADNGVAQTSGWTLGAAGAVTFATAPTSGHILTWDGSWRWPVCFAEPALNVEQFMFELYELQSLKLEQVKF